MDTSQALKSLLDWFCDGTQISFKKGEILIRPEDKPRDMYFLVSGFIKVYDLTKGGDENIRVFKKPGQVFPLVWLMKPHRRDSYYEAIDEVVVHRRSRRDFIEYLESNDGSSLALLEQMTEMYMIFGDRINNLEFRYARERIAYRLVSLVEIFGKKTSRGIQITLPIRQLELADATNVTRETASRELLRLKKKGVIDYQDTNYTILDIEALKKEY